LLYLGPRDEFELHSRRHVLDLRQIESERVYVRGCVLNIGVFDPKFLHFGRRMLKIVV